MKFAGVAVLAAVTGGAAAAQGVEDLPDRPIRRAEVIEVVKRQFAAMDTNHDGFVTEREFEAFRARQDRAPPQEGNPFDHVGRRWFERADGEGNGDGRVTLQEAEARPLHLFAMADTDHDGVVTPDEAQMAAVMMALGR